MRRLAGILGVMACVTLGTMIATSLVNTAAQSSSTLTIEAYVLSDTDTKDGDECFPWGFIDDSLEVNPFRQVIVTNNHGVIVGVMDLQVGKAVTSENGQRSCAMVQTIDLEESPFYTFAVDGKYRLTVSAEAIEDMGWHLRMHLLK